MNQADREDAAPGGGTLLPAWNPRGGSDSPSVRHPHQGLPLYKSSPGHHSVFPLSKRSMGRFAIHIFRCVSDSRFHFLSVFPCAWRNQARDFTPAYLCRQRLVPGGSCGLNPILTRLLHGVGHGGAVRTANCLRTYLPAVFAVQRSHALRHVKRGRG
jgi:hypothetical protein